MQLASLFVWRDFTVSSKPFRSTYLKTNSKEKNSLEKRKNKLTFRVRFCFHLGSIFVGATFYFTHSILYAELSLGQEH